MGNLKDKFSFLAWGIAIDTIKDIAIFVDYAFLFEILRGNSKSGRVEISDRNGFVNIRLIVFLEVLHFRIFEFLIRSNELSIKGKGIIHLSLHFRIDSLI